MAGFELSTSFPQGLILYFLAPEFNVVTNGRECFLLFFFIFCQCVFYEGLSASFVDTALFKIRFSLPEACSQRSGGFAFKKPFLNFSVDLK